MDLELLKRFFHNRRGRAAPTTQRSWVRPPHLPEPLHHAADGVLSYYDFGMELLDDMKRAGFSESFLICYRSARWGYPNENVAYVARKLAG